MAPPCAACGRRCPLTKELLQDLAILDRPSPQKARKALGVVDIQAVQTGTPLYRMADAQHESADPLQALFPTPDGAWLFSG